MKKPKSKSIAVLTIHGPGKMDRRSRKAISDWLIKHADNLYNLGDGYTCGRFTGRYFINS